MYVKKYNQEKIKTIFYTNEQIIKENWLNITSTIKEIFNYFEKHIKEEGYSLKKNYKIFGKKINELFTISELIKKEKNDTIIDGEIWIEVEEDTYFDDEGDEMFYTILQPKINPFELIEYSSIKSRIKIIECPQDIVFESNLNKFNKASAFCNSVNSLYISGGEISGKAINNFWIINKNNYKIKKRKLPVNKKYHSMLYISDNFIFIVGGDTLNTLIYDIANEEFINWANMNKNNFQPGLLINGDYIYSFTALNDINKNNNYFEKTNLTSKNPKWEIVYPKYENNVKLNSYFFGISKFYDGNILFVGGEKTNPNYIYNPTENKLTISKGRNTSIPFWDKTFYKISKKYNVCIPLNFTNNYQITFLNKENESLEDVKCDKTTGFIKFNIENDNEPGNIFIKSTIRNKKTKQNINIQIGLNPKNNLKRINSDYNYNYEYNTISQSQNIFKRNQNSNNINNINNEYEDEEENEVIDEEKIIIDNYYDNKENLQKANPIKSNKNYQKKSYIYIPESFVDEQIIKREVDLFDNEKAKNKDNSEEINNNGEGENITKDEIIIIGDLNQLDKNKNNVFYNTNRPLNKKEYLYIPNSIIDDQIINREITENEKYRNGNSPINNNINIEEDIPENVINDEEDNKVIINDENNFEKDNYDIKTKPSNNVKLLYVPYSSIDEQIIYRTIEINDDNNKNYINIENKDGSKPYLKKRIESSSKLTSSQNSEGKSKDNSDNENENENEINDYLNIINKEGDLKIKIIKNEGKIYIPRYAIEDQIINREVISNYKK